MMSNEMRYEYLEGLMPVGADPPHHRIPAQDVRRRLPTQGHAFLYGGDGVGGPASPVNPSEEVSGGPGRSTRVGLPVDP